MEPHDQTEGGWLAQADDKRMGTGIVILSYQAQTDTAEKFTFADVTYSQCVEQAAGALAFKWVPHDVVPADLAVALALAKNVCGEPCVDTCVRPTCVCVKGKCR